MENSDDVHKFLDRVLIQLYENGMMENSPNNNTITLNNISSAKPYNTIFSEGYTYDRYNIRWDVYVHNLQGEFQPYIFRWILFKFNILECGMYLKFLIYNYDNNLYSISQETVKDDNSNGYIHYIHKNPTISDVRPFINEVEISDDFQKECDDIFRRILTCYKYIIIELSLHSGTRAHANMIIIEKIDNNINVYHYEPHGIDQRIVNVYKTKTILKLFINGLKRSNESISNNLYTINDDDLFKTSCSVGMQKWSKDRVGFCYWYTIFVLYNILYIMYMIKSEEFDVKLKDITLHKWIHIITTYYTDDDRKELINPTQLIGTPHRKNINKYTIKNNVYTMIVNFTWWVLTKSSRNVDSYSFEELSSNSMVRSKNHPSTTVESVSVGKEEYKELLEKNNIHNKEEGEEEEDREFEYKTMDYYNEKMNEQQEIRRDFPIFGDSITNTTFGKSLIENMVGKQMMDTFDKKQNKSAVRKYRKMNESLRLINDKCKKSSDCKSKCCVKSVCRPYTVCVSSERVKKNREKAMENIRRSNIIENQKIPTDPFGSYIQKVYNKNVFPD